MPGPEDGSSVRTVNRISSVLRCFSSEEPVLTMTDISKRLKLPLSTVHRLISAMEKEGFLSRSPDGRSFQIGITLLEWGALAQYNLNFNNEAKPFLHALKEATNENAVLFVRDGAYGVSIETVESSQHLRVTTRIGERIPLYASAIVMVLLAFLPDAEIEKIVREFDFIQYTNATITNLPDLYRQIAVFRKQGYGVSTDWFSTGSVGISAPVFNYANQVVASLSAIAPSVRASDDRLNMLIDQVVSVARDLSHHFGYRQV